MRIDSKFKFEPYEPMGKILLKNPLQAARYVANGATLYDVIADGDYWMWVFDAKEVKPLFDLWCKHELK
jgi:hypothetical protein